MEWKGLWNYVGHLIPGSNKTDKNAEEDEFVDVPEVMEPRSGLSRVRKASGYDEEVERGMTGSTGGGPEGRPEGSCPQSSITETEARGFPHPPSDSESNYNNSENLEEREEQLVDDEEIEENVDNRDEEQGENGDDYGENGQWDDTNGEASSASSSLSVEEEEEEELVDTEVEDNTVGEGHERWEEKEETNNGEEETEEELQEECEKGETCDEQKLNTTVDGQAGRNYNDSNNEESVVNTDLKVLIEDDTIKTDSSEDGEKTGSEDTSDGGEEVVDSDDKTGPNDATGHRVEGDNRIIMVGDIDGTDSVIPGDTDFVDDTATEMKTYADETKVEQYERSEMKKYTDEADEIKAEEDKANEMKNYSSETMTVKNETGESKIYKDHTNETKTEKDETGETEIYKYDTVESRAVKDEAGELRKHADETMTGKDETSEMKKSKNEPDERQTSKDETCDTMIDKDGTNETKAGKDETNKTGESEKDIDETGQTQKYKVKISETKKDEDDTSEIRVGEDETGETQNCKDETGENKKGDISYETQKYDVVTFKTQRYTDKAKQYEDETGETKTEKDETGETKEDKDETGETKADKDEIDETEADKDGTGETQQDTSETMTNEDETDEPNGRTNETGEPQTYEGGTVEKKGNNSKIGETKSGNNENDETKKKETSERNQDQDKTGETNKIEGEANETNHDKDETSEAKQSGDETRNTDKTEYKGNTDDDKGGGNTDKQENTDEGIHDEDEMKLEDKMTLGYELKLENELKLEYEMKFDDEMKLESEIKLEEMKLLDEIILEYETKFEDEINHEQEINIEEIEHEDGMKIALETKLYDEMKLEDEMKHVDEVKLEGEIKLEMKLLDEIILEDGMKFEDETKFEDEINHEQEINIEEIEHENGMKIALETKLYDETKLDDEMKLEDEMKVEDEIIIENEIKLEDAEGNSRYIEKADIVIAVGMATRDESVEGRDEEETVGEVAIIYDERKKAKDADVSVYKYQVEESEREMEELIDEGIGYIEEREIEKLNQESENEKEDQSTYESEETSAIVDDGEEIENRGTNSENEGSDENFDERGGGEHKRIMQATIDEEEEENEEEEGKNIKKKANVETDTKGLDEGKEGGNQETEQIKSVDIKDEVRELEDNREEPQESEEEEERTEHGNYENAEWKVNGEQEIEKDIANTERITHKKSEEEEEKEFEEERNESGNINEKEENVNVKEEIKWIEGYEEGIIESEEDGNENNIITTEKPYKDTIVDNEEEEDTINQDSSNEECEVKSDKDNTTIREEEDDKTDKRKEKETGRFGKREEGVTESEDKFEIMERTRDTGYEQLTKEDETQNKYNRTPENEEENEGKETENNEEAIQQKGDKENECTTVKTLNIGEREISEAEEQNTTETNAKDSGKEERDDKTKKQVNINDSKLEQEKDEEEMEDFEDKTEDNDEIQTTGNAEDFEENEDKMNNNEERIEKINEIIKIIPESEDGEIRLITDPNEKKNNDSGDERLKMGEMKPKEEKTGANGHSARSQEINTRHQETDTRSQATDTRSQEIDTRRQETEAYSKDSRIRSQETDIRSQETDTRIHETDTRSQETDIRSQQTDTSSQETDIRSQENDTRSQETDIRSQETNIRSQETDTMSQYIDIRSQQTDTKSQETNIRSQQTDISIQDTDTRSKETDIRNQETDTRSQNTDMRSKQTDARSQDADIRCQETDISSQETDTSSQETDTRSQEPDIRSQDTNIRSQETNTRSQEADIRSQETNTRSQETEVRSQKTDMRSQNTDVMSQDTDIRSQETDIRSQETDIRSQETDTRSQETDIRSQDTDIRSQETDTRNKATDTRSQETDIRSQETNTRSQETEVRSQKTDVMSQDTDIKSQETDIRSQETEVRSQKTDIRSQNTDIMSQETDIRGQETDIRSQKTDIRSQDTDIRSQGTVTRSQETDIRSQETDIRSQNTDIRSQETNLRSQETNNRSQETDIRNQEIDIRSQENYIRSQETDIRSQMTDTRSQETDIRSQNTDIRSQETDIRKQETDTRSQDTDTRSQYTDTMSQEAENKAQPTSTKMPQFSDVAKQIMKEVQEGRNRRNRLLRDLRSIRPRTRIFTMRKYREKSVEGGEELVREEEERSGGKEGMRVGYRKERLRHKHEELREAKREGGERRERKREGGERRERKRDIEVKVKQEGGEGREVKHKGGEGRGMKQEGREERENKQEGGEGREVKQEGDEGREIKWDGDDGREGKQEGAEGREKKQESGNGRMVKREDGEGWEIKQEVSEERGMGKKDRKGKKKLERGEGREMKRKDSKGKEKKQEKGEGRKMKQERGERRKMKQNVDEESEMKQIVDKERDMKQDDNKGMEMKQDNNEGIQIKQGDNEEREMQQGATVQEERSKFSEVKAESNEALSQTKGLEIGAFVYSSVEFYEALQKSKYQRSFKRHENYRRHKRRSAGDLSDESVKHRSVIKSIRGLAENDVNFPPDAATITLSQTIEGEYTIPTQAQEYSKKICLADMIGNDDVIQVSPGVDECHVTERNASPVTENLEPPGDGHINSSMVVGGEEPDCCDRKGSVEEGGGSRERQWRAIAGGVNVWVQSATTRHHHLARLTPPPSPEPPVGEVTVLTSDGNGDCSVGESVKSEVLYARERDERWPLEGSRVRQSERHDPTDEEVAVCSPTLQAVCGAIQDWSQIRVAQDEVTVEEEILNVTDIQEGATSCLEALDNANNENIENVTKPLKWDDDNDVRGLEEPENREGSLRSGSDEQSKTGVTAFSSSDDGGEGDNLEASWATPQIARVVQELVVSRKFTMTSAQAKERQHHINRLDDRQKDRTLIFDSSRLSKAKTESQHDDRLASRATPSPGEAPKITSKGFSRIFNWRNSNGDLANKKKPSTKFADSEISEMAGGDIGDGSDISSTCQHASHPRHKENKRQPSANQILEKAGKMEKKKDAGSTVRHRKKTGSDSSKCETGRAAKNVSATNKLQPLPRIELLCRSPRLRKGRVCSDTPARDPSPRHSPSGRRRHHPRPSNSLQPDSVKSDSTHDTSTNKNLPRNPLTPSSNQEENLSLSSPNVMPLNEGKTRAKNVPSSPMEALENKSPEFEEVKAIGSTNGNIKIIATEVKLMEEPRKEKREDECEKENISTAEVEEECVSPTEVKLCIIDTRKFPSDTLHLVDADQTPVSKEPDTLVEGSNETSALTCTHESDHPQQRNIYKSSKMSRKLDSDIIHFFESQLQKPREISRNEKAISEHFRGGATTVTSMAAAFDHGPEKNTVENEDFQPNENALLQAQPFIQSPTKTKNITTTVNINVVENNENNVAGGGDIMRKKDYETEKSELISQATVNEVNDTHTDPHECGDSAQGEVRREELGENDNKPDGAQSGEGDRWGRSVVPGWGEEAGSKAVIAAAVPSKERQQSGSNIMKVNEIIDTNIFISPDNEDVGNEESVTGKCNAQVVQAWWEEDDSVYVTQEANDTLKTNLGEETVSDTMTYNMVDKKGEMIARFKQDDGMMIEQIRSQKGSRAEKNKPDVVANLSEQAREEICCVLGKTATGERTGYGRGEGQGDTEIQVKESGRTGVTSEIQLKKQDEIEVGIDPLQEEKRPNFTIYNFTREKKGSKSEVEGGEGEASRMGSCRRRSTMQDDPTVQVASLSPNKSPDQQGVPPLFPTSPLLQSSACHPSTASLPHSTETKTSERDSDAIKTDTKISIDTTDNVIKTHTKNAVDTTDNTEQDIIPHGTKESDSRVYSVMRVSEKKDIKKVNKDTVTFQIALVKGSQDQDGSVTNLSGEMDTPECSSSSEKESKCHKSVSHVGNNRGVFLETCVDDMMCLSPAAGDRDLEAGEEHCQYSSDTNDTTQTKRGGGSEGEISDERVSKANRRTHTLMRGSHRRLTKTISDGSINMDQNCDSDAPKNLAMFSHPTSLERSWTENEFSPEKFASAVSSDNKLSSVSEIFARGVCGNLRMKSRSVENIRLSSLSCVEFPNLADASLKPPSAPPSSSSCRIVGVLKKKDSREDVLDLMATSKQDTHQVSEKKTTTMGPTLVLQLDQTLCEEHKQSTVIPPEGEPVESLPPQQNHHKSSSVLQEQSDSSIMSEEQPLSLEIQQMLPQLIKSWSEQPQLPVVQHLLPNPSSNKEDIIAPNIEARVVRLSRPGGTKDPIYENVSAALQYLRETQEAPPASPVVVEHLQIHPSPTPKTRVHKTVHIYENLPMGVTMGEMCATEALLSVPQQEDKDITEVKDMPQSSSLSSWSATSLPPEDPSPPKRSAFEKTSLRRKPQPESESQVEKQKSNYMKQKTVRVSILKKQKSDITGVRLQKLQYFDNEFPGELRRSYSVSGSVQRKGRQKSEDDRSPDSPEYDLGMRENEAQMSRAELSELERRCHSSISAGSSSSRGSTIDRILQSCAPCISVNTNSTLDLSSPFPVNSSYTQTDGQRDINPSDDARSSSRGMGNVSHRRHQQSKHHYKSSYSSADVTTLTGSGSPTASQDKPKDGQVEGAVTDDSAAAQNQKEGKTSVSLNSKKEACKRAEPQKKGNKQMEDILAMTSSSTDCNSDGTYPDDSEQEGIEKSYTPTPTSEQCVRITDDTDFYSELLDTILSVVDGEEPSNSERVRSPKRASLQGNSEKGCQASEATKVEGCAGKACFPITSGQAAPNIKDYSERPSDSDSTTSVDSETAEVRRRITERFPPAPRADPEASQESVLMSPSAVCPMPDCAACRASSNFSQPLVFTFDTPMTLLPIAEPVRATSLPYVDHTCQGAAHDIFSRSTSLPHDSDVYHSTQIVCRLDQDDDEYWSAGEGIVKSTPLVTPRLSSPQDTSQDSSPQDSSPQADSGVEGCKSEADHSESSSNPLVEELSQLRMENEKLCARNQCMQSEVQKLRRVKETMVEEDLNLKPKLNEMTMELTHAKEALSALKADRKRLKAEKFDLINQMKQLYATLEDKEKELRDFIRNYEQRMKESDESLRHLATERDETEREKWNILKHARDESERVVKLSAHLGLKETALKKLQEEFEMLRKQLASVGYYSDAESVKTNGLPTPTASTPTCSPLPVATPTPTPNGRGSSADSGVRLSSDRDSTASHDGGPGTPKESPSLSPLYATPMCVRGGEDQMPTSTNQPHPHPNNNSTPLSGLANSSACSGGLSRSAEHLCEHLSEAVEPNKAEGRGTTTLTRKNHKAGGGTWGSISRVFARQKKRAALDTSIYDGSGSDKRASWSPSSSLCVSPLTEESYSGKLRLLEEAQHVPLERWKAPTVLAWLEVTLGMPQYGAMCAENVRSGKVLLELSDSELETGLDISHPMHRKKLRLAIEELREPRLTRFPRISVLGHTWVSSEWLPDLGLPQYSESFANSLVDGRLLEALTKKELEKHLGVHRKFHQASIIHGVHLLRIVRFDRLVLAERRRQSEMVDSDPVVWTNMRWVRWARSIDLAEYADNLKDSGVHGALVVLESSFTSDTMATALGIPQSKNIIRRHLATELEGLVLPARQQLDEQARYAKMERRRQEKLASGGSLGRSFSRSYGTGLEKGDKERRRASLRIRRIVFYSPCSNLHSGQKWEI